MKREPSTQADMISAAGSILVVAIFLLSGCTHTLPPYDYTAEPDPRKSEFEVGIGDHLQITVWRNQELSSTVIVRPDGTVTMPLIGDLKADGKTPTEIRAEVTRRLRKYYPEVPTVTVAVAQVNSYRFTVGGQVARGGAFSPSKFVTVSEAIALAGGITRFASAEKTLVIRTDRAGRVRKIPIDYTQIASGDRPDMNIVVLSGDTVYVP